VRRSEPEWHFFAGIAQLVEQLICNQQVVGSNPTAGSTFTGGSRDAGGDDEEVAKIRTAKGAAHPLYAKRAAAALFRDPSLISVVLCSGRGPKPDGGDATDNGPEPKRSGPVRHNNTDRENNTADRR
jgi:hypothetical protein